jgi:uncharacterized OB-fold protein
MSESYLPAGATDPVPAPDGLDTEYWEAASRHELVAQRCTACRAWQWGPEWICHKCLSFDVGWDQIEGPGRIYSWERPHHPVHPGLADACPYIVVLVEFPQADGIRMIGNLLGERLQDVPIGASVEPVFEDHPDADPAYTLVQYRLA